jgi:hypothetical protein
VTEVEVERREMEEHRVAQLPYPTINRPDSTDTTSSLNTQLILQPECVINSVKPAYYHVSGPLYTTTLNESLTL